MPHFGSQCQDLTGASLQIKAKEIIDRRRNLKFINNALIKNLTIKNTTTTNILVVNVDATICGTLKTDIIQEKTLDAGVTIDGVLHKDTDVTTTGNGSFQNVCASGWIQTDTIVPKTANATIQVCANVTVKDDFNFCAPNIPIILGNALQTIFCVDGDEDSGASSSSNVTIFTNTYSTLICLAPIGDPTISGILADGIKKNQLKMIRLHGTSGNVIVTPDNLNGGTQLNMLADPDDAHLSGLLHWSGTGWSLIDSNSPLVFIS